MALPALNSNHGLRAGLLAALLTTHPNVEARGSPDEAPLPLLYLPPTPCSHGRPFLSRALG